MSTVQPSDWASDKELSPVVITVAGQPCRRAVSPPIESLVRLLNQLQAYGVTLAIPAAGFGFTVSGLLWLTGIPEYQRLARRVFFNVTGGLVIVLLADAFVEMIRAPLCGGG